MVVRAAVVCALLLSAIALSRGTELKIQLEEPSVQDSVVTLDVEFNQSRTIELVQGGSYVISCISAAGGFQQPQVWSRDGFPVEVRVSGNVTADGVSAVYAIRATNNQWDLELKVFNSSATGTYSCHRGNKRVSLVIGSGNPVVIAGDPVLSLDIGSQGSNVPSLIAFVSGNPQPTTQQITWTQNGSPLTTTGRFFQLANIIATSHGGEYVCNVTTSADTATAHFTVLVNVISVAVISPNADQTVLEGFPLTLTCTDSRGIPPPTFQWEKDDALITGDGSRVVVTHSSEAVLSTLTINSVQWEDEGRYHCQGTNAVGTSTSDSVNVDVKFAPILSALSPRLTGMVGHTVVLEATLVAADPLNITVVTWSKDGRTSRGTPAVNGSRYTLTIPGLVLEDEGTYVLRVENDVGPGSQEFNLTVNSPPTLTADETTVYARYGVPNITLSLVITDARPPVEDSQISWSRVLGGVVEPIDLGMARYTSVLIGGSELSLTLSNPVLADSGTYTVTIEHDTGNFTRNIELLVLHPPAPPTSINATLVDGSACMARIQWTTPPTSDSFTAPTNYTVIEARVGIGGEWVEVGRGVNVVEAKIPFSGPDTRYRLRGRGVSDLVGEGDNMEESQEFTAYLAGSLPSVEVFGSPATPTSIRVSWTTPQQECFLFISHTPSCTREGKTTASAVSQTGSGLVEGLDVDSLYNCSVSSEVTGVVGGTHTVTVNSSSVVTFTYPNAPPTPDPPRVNESSPNTITVNFDLPENHQEISHYQVIVLRLTSLDATPSESPDTLYPSGFVFDTHTSVHSEERAEYKPYIAAELAGGVFSPVFVLGSGLRTNGSGTLYVNERLASDTPYTCFLRAFPKTFYDRPFRRKRDVSSRRQYDVFSSSGFLQAQQTVGVAPPADTLLPLVIGVCVAGLVVLLCLIVLVGVAICCLRSRRRNKYRLSHKAQVDHSPSDSGGNTPDYQPTPNIGRETNGIELKQINMVNPMSNGVMYEPSGPIKEENFAAHVERFDANRQLLFQEEFEWIQTNSSWHPAEASNHPLNDDKNRYHNITAFDHTRVKLSPEIGVECSDYINANYVLGYSGKNEYIATQGPLDQTVVEFWKMIWEQNTHTIVMLTNLVELGKVKCTQYWPVSGTVIYGGVKVTLERVVELPDYVIRNLLVSPLISTENESRLIMQFQFTRWPDYGVPNLAAPLLNFLKAVNMSNPSDTGPVVIHCSAGVGRSGTVITINYCLKQLKADGFMDPCGFVQQMRNQRNYMVQTEQQYTFLHFALLEAITYGDTSYEITEFNDSYHTLKEAEGTFLEEEFGRIGGVKTMTKRSSFQQKIKQKGAPQRHFNSSFMGSMNSNSAALEPYNAHYLDTYLESRRLVVVDGPTEDSVGKWWQMVWDEDVAYIVNLTPQDEEVFQYWPKSGCVQHGGIVVEVEIESAEHLYTRRKIKLTNAKVEGISHSVELFHFIGWSTEFLPRVPDFVGFLVDVMKGVKSLKKNQRLLLHDIYSLGPCGVMCSLYFCIERLRTERIVDVFQAVQMIKLQRPGSVRTVQEYAFIYDCVFEYIRIHSNLDSDSQS